MWCQLLLLALLAVAQGAPSATEIAERDRVLAEIEQLESRGFWKGVDRSYRELEGLLERGIVAPSSAHLAGAEAARSLGDIDALVTRLERARRAGADAGGALRSVRERFARVVLEAPRRRDASLEPVAAPFELDARAAIAAAATQLEETGRYQGFLPVGEYLFAGQAFVLEPSEEILAVTVERASKRGRPQAAPDSAATPAEQPAAEPLSADRPPAAPPADDRPARPWLTAQLSLGGGATSTASAGVQPVRAAGFAPGVGVTGALPLTGAWAVQAGLAYRGLLGSAPVGGGSQQLHLGLASLQAVWAPGSWAVGAGPAVARGVGSATGIDAEALLACVDPTCGAPPPLLDQEEAAAVSLRGTLGAGGVVVQATRALGEGPLTPGIGLEGAWLSDGVRSYVWGGAVGTLRWGAP